MVLVIIKLLYWEKWQPYTLSVHCHIFLAESIKEYFADTSYIRKSGADIRGGGGVSYTKRFNTRIFDRDPPSIGTIKGPIGTTLNLDQPACKANFYFWTP